MTDVLNQGSREYLDALVAIKAFQKEVRKQCENAYNAKRPELVRTIGLRDKPCEELKGGDHSEKLYAEVGVQQKSEDGTTLSVYVMWQRTPQGVEISACVCLDFELRDDRDQYYQELRKTIRTIDRGDWNSLWTSEPLRALSTCETALVNMLDTWIKHWPAQRKLKS